MTEHDDLERTLARWFEADALGPTPPGRLQEAIEATRTLRPRPAALARFGSGWVETWPSSDTPRVAWGLAAVLVLILLALAASAIYVGSLSRTLPSVVGPAGNGLIAYGSGGDIFVGDPQTGRTTAIVTGPAMDTRPVFSPDGARIAFVRLDPSTVGESLPADQPCGSTSEGCRFLVVQPDGSAERDITPDDGRFFDFFAWTPDGSGIVINYGHGLAVLHAEGVGDLQNLSPPLPKWPGAGYFDANDQVAAMFRPPTGDRILSYEGYSITERDAEGTKLRTLIGTSVRSGRFASISWPEWSPDGSKIAFVGDPVDSNDGGSGFVMNADGSDVRRLVASLGGFGLAWSPDSSRIAVVQADLVPAGSTAYCPVTWSQDHCPSAMWISTVDADDGTERIVEGTRDVAGDEEAGILGWSWAPDGRSLLLLRKAGTRLVTVDVETGLATELPWAADSPASWQRVAPGDSG